MTGLIRSKEPSLDTKYKKTLRTEEEVASQHKNSKGKPVLKHIFSEEDQRGKKIIASSIHTTTRILKVTPKKSYVIASRTRRV